MQTHIFYGEPCAVENDPDYFPLLIGNYILGSNNMLSRLFVEIREQYGFAYDIKSSLILLQKPGPFVIHLQTSNLNVKKIIQLLKNILNKFIADGPSIEELNNAKNYLRRSFSLEINTNAKKTETLSELGFYKYPLNFLETYQQNIDRVSLLEIKEAFKKRLHPDKMVLITVGKQN